MKKAIAGFITGVFLVLLLSATALAADVTLTLSADSGRRGASIEISGTYTPDEWVTVKVSDSDGNIVFLKPVRAQDDGTYQTTFIVPDVEAGELQIVTGNGPNVESAQFRVKSGGGGSPTMTPVLTASPTPVMTLIPTLSPAQGAPSSDSAPEAIPNGGVTPTPALSSSPEAAGGTPTASPTPRETATPISSAIPPAAFETDAEADAGGSASVIWWVLGGAAVCAAAVGAYLLLKKRGRS